MSCLVTLSRALSFVMMHAAVVAVEQEEVLEIINISDGCVFEMSKNPFTVETRHRAPDIALLKVSHNS